MLSKLFPLLLSFSTLTSCIGFATVGGVTQSITQPSAVDYEIRQRKGSSSVARSEPWTKKEIEALFGVPNETREKSGRTLWYYDDNWTGKGLVLMMIVVPIPLMLPYKNYETELVFREQQLVAINLRENKFKLALGCGLVSPFTGCYAGWLNESGEADGKRLFKFEKARSESSFLD